MKSFWCRIGLHKWQELGMNLFGNVSYACDRSDCHYHKLEMFTGTVVSDCTEEQKCSCGQNIVHIKGKYWALASNGREVCTENHWHFPGRPARNRTYRGE